METTTITHNRPEADADISGLANLSVSLLAGHRSVIQVYLVAQVCQMLKVLVHEAVMVNKVPPETQLPPMQKFWLYLRRAASLRCPVCGISPIFLSFKQVEGIPDWFATLPGCPRCDYVYDREPGYFLFALWMINFSLVAIVGIALLFLLDFLFADLSVGQLIFFTLIPLWILGILSARHTKAFFMALDHWVNPVDHE